MDVRQAILTMWLEVLSNALAFGTLLVKDRPEAIAVRCRGDLEELRALFGRFCRFEGEFGPHAMFGQMSRAERMRHAFLHIDHHLRQFGA